MKTHPNDAVGSFLRPEECWEEGHGSLSKREYFAAMAMQGILANQSTTRTLSPVESVELSVMCADILIKNLNKGVESK